MTNTMTQTTTPISSGFGMPACGYASDAITGPIAAFTGAIAGAGVRDRQAGVALGHTEKTFPWTTAWRPPIS